MDEARLVAKLKALEALFAGAATDGERTAAAYARDRMLERLAEVRKREPDVEYQFTLANAWSKKLFVALVRRYGLHPYRYPRQRSTTVMVRGPKRFFDKTLWPHYVRINEELRKSLDELADRVIAQAMDASTADEEECAESPRALPSETRGNE